MELNWLTDHIAVSEISGSHGDLLTGVQAQSSIAQNPGLVPAAIDPSASEVVWADVGSKPLQEWQFLFSLQTIAQSDGHLVTIRTPIEELADAREAAGDSISPGGFIFHMSRCGSTLLGNVLSGSPKHLVINQPGPLQDGFWTYLTRGWTNLPTNNGEIGSSQDVSNFQHLVHLILRRRSPKPLQGFIKFRSWAVLFLPFIQRAFPDVPCVFLYRDPREVVASSIQKKNVAVFATRPQRAFLADCNENDIDNLSDIHFMQRCYAAYFKKVLASSQNRLWLLNYNRLKPDALPRLLVDVFSIDPKGRELEQMLEQFQYYSKDPRANRNTFDAGRDRKAKIEKVDQFGAIDPCLLDLYVTLNRSASNLYPEPLSR
jgi:hypothetical protein